MPLELWLGKWEPGAALVLQDRAVLVWGRTEVQAQIIPRKRPGGVAEVDVQSDAITLWIDCEQPRNVRVKRYEGTTDVPTTFADMLRPDHRDRERHRRAPAREWSSARTASARSTRAPTSARTAAATSARSPSARRSSGSSSRCCCSCCCC